MRAAWILALAVVACSAPIRETDDAPRHPRAKQPEPPPITIAAPHALTWTAIASGSESGARDRMGSESSEDPVLATHVRGAQIAMVLSTNGVALRLLRATAHATPIDIVLEPEPAQLAGVVVGERDVKTIIYVRDGFATATIDLATAKIVARAHVALAKPARIRYVARIPTGWIIAGYRVDATKSRQTDSIAWALGDADTALPAAFTIATSREPHQFAWIRGAIAADGTAFVDVERGIDGSHADHVAATYRAGTWHVVTPYPGVEYPTLAAAGGGIAIARPSADALSLYTLAGAQQRPLDTSWAGTNRRNVGLYAFGTDLVVFGGDVPQPRTNRRDAYDGAVYDLARGGVRTFTAPSLGEQLVGATWRPALVLPVDGQLCLLGGYAFSTTVLRGGRVDGAACLDHATLAWEWLAAPELPQTCALIGEAVVLCQRRHVTNMPGNWEWPARQIIGPFDWSLWSIAKT